MTADAARPYTTPEELPTSEEMYRTLYHGTDVTKAQRMFDRLLATARLSLESGASAEAATTGELDFSDICGLCHKTYGKHFGDYCDETHGPRPRMFTPAAPSPAGDAAPPDVEEAGKLGDLNAELRLAIARGAWVQAKKLHERVTRAIGAYMDRLAAGSGDATATDADERNSDMLKFLCDWADASGLLIRWSAPNPETWMHDLTEIPVMEIRNGETIWDALRREYDANNAARSRGRTP